MKVFAGLIPSFIAFAAFYFTPKAGASPSPLEPRASPQAVCSYTCPPTNTLGTAIGESRKEGSTIHCSYPLFAGESPNDLFCRYDLGDGHLKEDHDVLLCPATAPQTCVTRRRDISSIQAIVARQNSERALRRSTPAANKPMSSEKYPLKREEKMKLLRNLRAKALS